MEIPTKSVRTVREPIDLIRCPVVLVSVSGDPRWFRAGAARHSRRRPWAKRHRRSGRSEPDTITLRDGAELVVRPIGPRDKTLLAELVDALSDETSYRRFLGAKSRLTTAELRYFTEIDHHHHDALLAIDPRTGAAVAVARYIRDRRRRDSAELAVLVGDPWQARGLGTALSERLAQRAREKGIRRFRALTLSDNKPAHKLSARLGSPSFVRDGPNLELEIDLTATPASATGRPL